MRHCSKPGCSKPAVGTLTYDYANSTAVVGPLATVVDPHTYDLCEYHVQHLTVPKGWEVIRLEIRYDEVPPSEDDLMDLVDAVRKAAHRPAESTYEGQMQPFVSRSSAIRDRLTVISGEEQLAEESSEKTNGNLPTPKGPF